MTRTLLFGLDGATFTVLDPLMRDGTMPNLAAFAARGARADLISTPNPITPPGWTSMTTGRSPGQHGILDFIRAEERAQGMFFRVTDGRDNRCETVWSMASRQGRRITALNFFGMWPPRPVDGYTIPGFVPGRHLRRASWPPTLFDGLAGLPDVRVRDLGMDLDEEKKSVQGMPEDEYEAWIRMHIQREQRWFAVLRHFLVTDPCDLVGIVFDGVDKIQHLCWRYVDPALASPEPTGFERKIRALCLDYFRQLDRFLGDALGLVGPDAHVVVASDHGFGATTELVYVNVWLERQGLLRWAGDNPLDGGESIMVSRLKNHVSLVDWKTTRAYALTPSSNGIWIRGVEPAHYHEFRARLVEQLRAFRDPAGEPVIAAVKTREEIFAGPAMHQAPDLTLTLRDGGLVSILNADAPWKPRVEPAGTHRYEGVLLVGGPGVRPGARLEARSILDVAPLLLHSLGLPVPDDLEGRFPDAAFSADWLGAHPVRREGRTHGPADGASEGAQIELDAGDEAMIADRLRQLGYLE
jgi:predicted AlkP superfamily phosphohydrolase/phosphomutase